MGHDAISFYFVCPLLDGLPGAERRPGLRAIGMVISITLRDVEGCNEVGFSPDARKCAA
jgi:hypothetical protein